MFDTPEIMRIAQDMARHAGARQAKTAENVANADTPGYRAQDLSPFMDTFGAGLTSSAMKLTRSQHIATADVRSVWQTLEVSGQADPNGNTVSLEAELVRGASAKSSHDLALTIYRSSMDILRTSLGRGR